MQTDYHRDQITSVLTEGPADGDDFFRIKVWGKSDTKFLNASKDQLRVLADVMDETNPRSLLPLQNGARVLYADTWVNRDGVQEGYVIADVAGDAGEPFVTWHVWLHKNESRWLAGNGDYCATIEKAIASFNERRGVKPVKDVPTGVYLVSWTGGYEQPSHFTTTNEAEARAKFADWLNDAKLDEGDWVTLHRYHMATGALEEIESH